MSDNFLGYELNVLCTRCSNHIVSSCVSAQESHIICPKCGRKILTVEAINGYVYILSNPQMPSVVKIGFSTRKVEDRVAELNSSSGVPSPFNIESYFSSINPQRDEKEIHKKFSSYRVSENREFFEISPDQARNLISQVLNRKACYVSQEIRIPRDSNKTSNKKVGEDINTYRFVCPVCDNEFYARRSKNTNYKDCPGCGATAFNR